MILNIAKDSQSNGVEDVTRVDDSVKGGHHDQVVTNEVAKFHQTTLFGKGQTHRSGPMDETHIPKKF